MTAAAWLRASAAVFVAALLQVVIVSSLVIAGGAPDLLLVVVVALGLLRGSIPGAVLGFVGGLVVDFVTLGTLGVTSLILTLAGFWAVATARRPVATGASPPSSPSARSRCSPVRSATSSTTSSTRRSSRGTLS